MAEYGYKVRWEPNLKYITYTTPENVRCRDNKLFDQTLLRSSMEAYFDMGGCEYLESRIDATEYGELLPTVDDAVCGLISILDAMNTGDNDRFHLETLHHSKQEIRRILERGGKIDRTVEYAVDDEDEEYEQYHGFSITQIIRLRVQATVVLLMFRSFLQHKQGFPLIVCLPQ